MQEGRKINTLSPSDVSHNLNNKPIHGNNKMSTPFT